MYERELPAGMGGRHHHKIIQINAANSKGDRFPRQLMPGFNTAANAVSIMKARWWNSIPAHTLCLPLQKKP